MTQRIRIKDAEGREIDVASLRPSAHSAALDSAVSRMVGAGNDYRAAIARENARLVFTAAGETEMRRGHARKALDQLRDAFKQARQQAVGEAASAHDRFQAALLRNAPELTAATAPVAVALAARLAADPRLRQRVWLMATGQIDDADFEAVEYARAAVRLPAALTGFSVFELATIKGALAADEAAALARASAAEDYVTELAATFANNVAQDAQLGIEAVPSELVEAMQTATPRPLTVGATGRDPGTVGPAPADEPAPSDEGEQPSGNKLDGLTSGTVPA